MKKTKRAARAKRTSPPPCSAARWRRICKLVCRGHANPKPANVEFIINHVFEGYGRMCDRMQEQCQKYRLGLGGDLVDKVICDEIDRIHGKPNKAI